MIFHDIHRVDDHVILLGNPLEHQLGVFSYLLGEDSLAVFRNPHEMVFEFVDRVFASSKGTHALTLQRSLTFGKRKLA